MHGYDIYDYGMRGYYAAIMRFTTPDPLAEKYYSVSPYAYCLNNPVNRIDPTGMNYYIVNEDGSVILALVNEDKTDQLFAVKKTDAGNAYTDVGGLLK